MNKKKARVEGEQCDAENYAEGKRQNTEEKVRGKGQEEVLIGENG